MNFRHYLVPKIVISRWPGITVRALTVCLLLCLFSAYAWSQKSPAAKFRAAVVKIDITPEDSQNLLGYGARKSTGILDRIYHRIILLDDGVTQFFLVSSDLCVFSPAEYDKLAAKLKSLYGINPVNFWWTVTHTHSAPEVGPPGLGTVFLGERFLHEIDANYTARVEQKLIEGINEAREKLVPVRLGVGWGFSQANINRRAVDIDGKASLGLNPDGPVDRKIGLIRLDKMDGSPLALIANYPIHGTVLGFQNVLISGDAPGVVSEYVEQQIGVPMLFVNGAAGDLAPIYSVYPSAKEGHLGQFRVLLGDRILEAYRRITADVDVIKIKAGELTVETPRKKDLGWSAELSNYNRSTKSGEHLVRLPVRFLFINDNVAIWSTPLELFCEISNGIRERSPFPYTFYFGYTNGWLGYLPTESAWKYGGYEVEVVSPYSPVAGKDLSEAVLGYLQER